MWIRCWIRVLPLPVAGRDPARGRNPCRAADPPSLPDPGGRPVSRPQPASAGSPVPGRRTRNHSPDTIRRSLPTRPGGQFTRPAPSTRDSSLSCPGEQFRWRARGDRAIARSDRSRSRPARRPVNSDERAEQGRRPACAPSGLVPGPVAHRRGPARRTGSPARGATRAGRPTGLRTSAARPVTALGMVPRPRYQIRNGPGVRPANVAVNRVDRGTIRRK